MLDQLEKSIREFILDICVVMYKYGYPEVSVGTIMRLMGIGDESSSQLDDEVIILDETFEQVIEHYKQEENKHQKITQELPPVGTTLH